MIAALENEALLRARAGSDDVSEAGGPAQERKLPWFDTLDSDTAAAVDKARIQELWNEAETLEEAYRDYQQRAVHSTITHKLISRPLSPRQVSRRSDSLQRKKMSHFPRSHLPHESKVSHRPRSPQNDRTHPTAPSDTLPSAQLRVTVSKDNIQPQKSTDLSHHRLYSFTEPLFGRDGVPQERSDTPPTPPCLSRNNLHRDISEGTFKTCFHLSTHLETD